MENTKVEENGWIKGSDRWPIKEEYPVEVTDGKESAIACYASVDYSPKPSAVGKTYEWDNTITHWRRIKFSALPIPELTEEDKALAKHITGNWPNFTDEKSTWVFHFLAGFKAGKESNV